MSFWLKRNWKKKGESKKKKGKKERKKRKQKGKKRKRLQGIRQVLDRKKKKQVEEKLKKRLKKKKLKKSFSLGYLGSFSIFHRDEFRSNVAEKAINPFSFDLLHSAVI